MNDDATLLKPALQALAKMGLLAIRVPETAGGCGFKHADDHFYKKKLAQYSAALAFLQTQHQTAGRHILNGDNDILKKTILPFMKNGKYLVGMGLSPHLAQWENPPVTAIEYQEGYLIEQANIHFVTGLHFFKYLIIGFVVTEKISQEKREITAFIPFKNMMKSADSGLRFSAPHELVVAKSTNTVSLTIKNWFIPKTKVVTNKPLMSFYKAIVGNLG